MFKIVLHLVLVAVFLESVLAINDDQKAHIRNKLIKVGSECINDHPLTVEDIASFRNKVFPDGGNAGCFSACVFNKIGLFDDKGSLSHSTALENAKNIFEDKEELDSIDDFLTTCAKVNEEEVTDGEKGCERAKLAFECFVENYEQFGFNIEF